MSADKPGGSAPGVCEAMTPPDDSDAKSVSTPISEAELVCHHSGRAVWRNSPNTVCIDGVDTLTGPSTIRSLATFGKPLVSAPLLLRILLTFVLPVCSAGRAAGRDCSP